MLRNRSLIASVILPLFASFPVWIFAQPTTSSVYTIENGKVVFPGWDSREIDSKEQLAEIGVADFPDAVVYAERLLLTGKPAKSKLISIPESATTITVTARSRLVGSVFPRIKVSLVQNGSTSRELFNGYWQSVALDTYAWNVPTDLKGKKAHLLLEILNPGIFEEQRCWYFLRANIY